MNGSLITPKLITKRSMKIMPSGEKITQEKIIRAVLDTSFVKSVGATSLADIADKLGIKKASLYNHYANREAIMEDTSRWCGDFMRKTTFIPSDMDAIAQKYPADTVLKGIVNRWFKMNEKEPMFQIYSFLESEKYFSTDAAKIVSECRNKLIDQTTSALCSLVAAKKIRKLDAAAAHGAAVWFTGAVRDMLDTYLVGRKTDIRSNPETGAGALFSALPQSTTGFTECDRLVEQFCALLKS